MSLVVGIRIPYVLHIIILPSQKENGLPRRFAPRDGGIPRFIDLPPSPFRGNDSTVLYAAFSFTYWQSLYTGDPFGTSCHFP